MESIKPANKANVNQKHSGGLSCAICSNKKLESLLLFVDDQRNRFFSNNCGHSVCGVCKSDAKTKTLSCMECKRMGVNKMVSESTLSDKPVEYLELENYCKRRKEITQELALVRSNFQSTPAYNVFLEKREEIICLSEDTEESLKYLREVKQKYQKEIPINVSKQNDELAKQQLEIEKEMRERERVMEQSKKEEEERVREEILELQELNAIRLGERTKTTRQIREEEKKQRLEMLSKRGNVHTVQQTVYRRLPLRDPNQPKKISTEKQAKERRAKKYVSLSDQMSVRKAGGLEDRMVQARLRNDVHCGWKFVQLAD